MKRTKFYFLALLLLIAIQAITFDTYASFDPKVDEPPEFPLPPPPPPPTK